MPQPSAPMLQAEYHNYNEHSSFNDYYGGYEPKATSSWSATNGPRRVEVTVSKENRKFCAPGGIHCLNALVFCRSVVILVCLAFFFYSGFRNEAAVFLTGFELVNVFACLMMACGIEGRNPFCCVLFTVLRTLEAFISLVFVLAFGWAVVDPSSDAARFIRAFVKEIGQQKFVGMKFGWDDFAYTLSMFACLASLMVFAMCVFAMRVSWVATMWAADERKRQQYSSNREVSRVMVASDELYTNY